MFNFIKFIREPDFLNPMNDSNVQVGNLAKDFGRGAILITALAISMLGVEILARKIANQSFYGIEVRLWRGMPILYLPGNQWHNEAAKLMGVIWRIATIMSAISIPVCWSCCAYFYRTYKINS